MKSFLEDRLRYQVEVFSNIEANNSLAKNGTEGYLEISGICYFKTMGYKRSEKKEVKTVRYKYPKSIPLSGPKDWKKTAMDRQNVNTPPKPALTVPAPPLTATFRGHG